MSELDEKSINDSYEHLRKEAEDGGYNLNPDVSFTKMLVEGLLLNNGRYGYPACPCRLASGVKLDDLDIICPCDYRDPDIAEFGACYCALYVSDEIAKGKKKAQSIPERRPPKKSAAPIIETTKKTPETKDKTAPVKEASQAQKLSYPVWRCKVCGYLCARESPPEKCPICKVSKERFEQFM